MVNRESQMSSNTVKVIATAALIGALSSAPAFADGWGRGGGYFWGPAAAIGLIGAVIGAGIAAQNCVEYQPVYDQFGNIVGRRPVNVCD